MITLQEQSGLIEASVFGEWTVADLHALEEAVDHAERFSGTVRILLDLRQMLTSTLDAAWEEVGFLSRHAPLVDRIAVITDSEWLTWIAWLERLFFDAEIAVFRDETEARIWLAASPSEGEA
ncbi:MAG: STAS/SEC14 domain-containing protein [Hydrogenophilus sp.]|nr:STAS/SEC14 domain-containing protein [Hydrogenophilus sp.]